MRLLFGFFLLFFLSGCTIKPAFVTVVGVDDRRQTEWGAPQVSSDPILIDRTETRPFAESPPIQEGDPRPEVEGRESPPPLPPMEDIPDLPEFTEEEAADMSLVAERLVDHIWELREHIKIFQEILDEYASDHLEETVDQ